MGRILTNEQHFAKFRKHFSCNIPIAIISPIFTFQGKRQKDKSVDRLSQAQAQEIFEKTKHKIRAFGFGFIEATGKYFQQAIGRYAEKPCYIIYGIPIENTGQFYDGTIKPSSPQFKLTAGYQLSEAEAQLKQLAMIFGKNFGL